MHGYLTHLNILKSVSVLNSQDFSVPELIETNISTVFDCRLEDYENYNLLHSLNLKGLSIKKDIAMLIDNNSSTR